MVGRLGNAWLGEEGQGAQALVIAMGGTPLTEAEWSFQLTRHLVNVKTFEAFKMVGENLVGDYKEWRHSLCLASVILVDEEEVLFDATKKANLYRLCSWVKKERLEETGNDTLFLNGSGLAALWAWSVTGDPVFFDRVDHYGIAIDGHRLKRWCVNSAAAGIFRC